MTRHKYHIIYIILYICILAIISIPMIVQIIGKPAYMPLKGAYYTTNNQKISLESWLSGDYQDVEAKYLNDNFGFRSLGVRLFNQYYFSCYGVARAKGVEVGKDHYLYEENYIKAVYGIDYIGEELINEKVTKLKTISDSLAKKGITLITILAPGKGSYYPEYFPENYKPKNNPTNYEIWKKELKSNNIHLLDLNQWFRDQKAKSPYPLFPKNGVHWSTYAEIISMDSILGYMETLDHKILPRIIIDSVELSDNMQFTDQDAEESLNLLFDLDDLKMAYPYFHYKTDSTTYKPNVIVVSDSYYWGIYGRGINNLIFNKNEFWYYFQERYVPGVAMAGNINGIDAMKELEGTDFLILMSTDANLEKFAFGFIEILYNEIQNPEYHNTLESKREERVQQFIFSIKASPDWLKAVEAKAKKNNISLEEAIRLDAEYMVDQEMKKEN